MHDEKYAGRGVVYLTLRIEALEAENKRLREVVRCWASEFCLALPEELLWETD